MPEKKVKPYVAKDQADFDYRNQMYSDSLDLYNFSNFQKENEINFGTFDFPTEEEKQIRDAAQFKMQKEALRLVKDNSKINFQLDRYSGPGAGFYNDEGVFVNVADLSTEEVKNFDHSKYKIKDVYTGPNSPDIVHDDIKPIGEYEGDGKNLIYQKPTQPVVPGDYPDETEGGMLDSAIGFMADPVTTRPSFPTRPLIMKADGTVDWQAEEEGGHLGKPRMEMYQQDGENKMRFTKDPTTPGYIPGPINRTSGGMTYGHYPKMDPIDVPVFNRENKIWEQPPSLNPMDVEDYDLDIDTIVAIQEGTASDEFVRPNVSGVRSNRHWATVNFPGEAPRGMTKDEYTSYFKNKSKLDKRTAANNQFKMGGQLPQYGNGDEIKPYVAKDAADFAYRQQMYNDSLQLYNSYIDAAKFMNNHPHFSKSETNPYNEDMNSMPLSTPEFEGEGRKKGNTYAYDKLMTYEKQGKSREERGQILRDADQHSEYIPRYGSIDYSILPTGKDFFTAGEVTKDYINNRTLERLREVMQSAEGDTISDTGWMPGIETFNTEEMSYEDIITIDKYQNPTQKVYPPSEGFPNTTNGEFTREITNIPQDARNTGSLEGAIGLLQLGKMDPSIRTAEDRLDDAINEVEKPRDIAPGLNFFGTEPYTDYDEFLIAEKEFWNSSGEGMPSPIYTGKMLTKEGLSPTIKEMPKYNLAGNDRLSKIMSGTMADQYVRPNVSNVKSDRHWATANFPGEAPKGMSKKEYEDYFFKKGKYAKDTRVTDSFKYGGALNRYGNGGEIGDLPLTPPSPAPIDNTYTNITTPNYTSEEMAQMISDQQDLEDKALLEEIEMQTSSLSDMWGDTKAFGDSFLNAWDLDQIKSENRLLKNNADIDWQDDYYADTFELEDPRVIRATTGDSINPNVDLKGGHYNKQVVSGIVDRALKLGVDPYEAIAVGLQESLLGKRDPNLGHVQEATADEKGLDIVNDPFAFVDILKDKLNWAEKDSVFDRASALQYYNGTGPLFPETEQGYHGYKMQKAYGVPIPKEGLSMKEHPLYGKEIGDIIEGILKHNTYINELISSK
tara:strand:+ start:7864 stop:11049 length:3186 start_codon:yes stop_codon:yes gene_type:complete